MTIIDARERFLKRAEEGARRPSPADSEESIEADTVAPPYLRILVWLGEGINIQEVGDDVGNGKVLQLSLSGIDAMELAYSIPYLLSGHPEAYTSSRELSKNPPITEVVGLFENGKGQLAAVDLHYGIVRNAGLQARGQGIVRVQGKWVSPPRK